MNNECKSAGGMFFILSLYSFYMNSPNFISVGSLLCSITGVLCHKYGYRKIDIITTTLVILINLYNAYLYKYINNYSIILALYGTLMYLMKTDNHVINVQLPFYISIIILINKSSLKKCPIVG